MNFGCQRSLKAFRLQPKEASSALHGVSYTSYGSFRKSPAQLQRTMMAHPSHSNPDHWKEDKDHVPGQQHTREQQQQQQQEEQKQHLAAQQRAERMRLRQEERRSAKFYRENPWAIIFTPEMLVNVIFWSFWLIRAYFKGGS